MFADDGIVHGHKSLFRIPFRFTVRADLSTWMAPYTKPTKLVVTYLLFRISVPSEAPSGMEAVLLNSTAVILKWKPPPPSTHNGIIRSYLVSDIYKLQECSE